MRRPRQGPWERSPGAPLREKPRLAELGFLPKPYGGPGKRGLCAKEEVAAECSPLGFLSVTETYGHLVTAPHLGSPEMQRREG